MSTVEEVPLKELRDRFRLLRGNPKVSESRTYVVTKIVKGLSYLLHINYTDVRGVSEW